MGLTEAWRQQRETELLDRSIELFNLMNRENKRFKKQAVSEAGNVMTKDQTYMQLESQEGYKNYLKK